MLAGFELDTPDHELGVLSCADIFFVSICILPFVLLVPIPPRSKLLITSILTVIHISSPHHKPGRVAQSVARLTKEPEVPGPNSVRPHTFLSPSAESRMTVVSYWRKYVHN